MRCDEIRGMECGVRGGACQKRLALSVIVTLISSRPVRCTVIYTYNYTTHSSPNSTHLTGHSPQLQVSLCVTFCIWSPCHGLNVVKIWPQFYHHEGFCSICTAPPTAQLKSSSEHEMRKQMVCDRDVSQGLLALCLHMAYEDTSSYCELWSFPLLPGYTLTGQRTRMISCRAFLSRRSPMPLRFPFPSSSSLLALPTGSTPQIHFSGT